MWSVFQKKKKGNKRHQLTPVEGSVMHREVAKQNKRHDRHNSASLPQQNRITPIGGLSLVITVTWDRGKGGDIISSISAHLFHIWQPSRQIWWGFLLLLWRLLTGLSACTVNSNKTWGPGPSFSCKPGAIRPGTWAATTGPKSARGTRRRDGRRDRGGLCAASRGCWADNSVA